MKTITVSLMTISLLFFSCVNTANEKSNKEIPTPVQEEHQHNAEIQTIEYNNGEKWVVDATMLPHIRNMEADMNSFTNGESKNYKLLSEKLQSNIDLLTSVCTMEGKAHDELHKWLLPFIDLVSRFSEVNNEAEALKQSEDIQASFTVFNQYFQ